MLLTFVLLALAICAVWLPPLRLTSSAAANDEPDVPPAGTVLPTTFTYTIDDGHGGTDTATLTVTVTARNDVDTQTGTRRVDTLIGDRNSAGTEDTIYGLQGDDRIDGKAGADTLYGGIGNDTLFGGDGIDKLYGEAGNDILHGGNGRDTLVGDEGDDKLYGESGDDILVGGTGNDVLEGGSGDDIFVFLPGEFTSGSSRKVAESDVITDFEVGEDILSLQGGVTIIALTEQSGSLVIQLSSGGFITLQGVTLAEWSNPANDSLQMLPTVDLF